MSEVRKSDDDGLCVDWMVGIFAAFVCFRIVSFCMKINKIK